MEGYASLLGFPELSHVFTCQHAHAHCAVSNGFLRGEALGPGASAPVPDWEVTPCSGHCTGAVMDAPIAVLGRLPPEAPACVRSIFCDFTRSTLERVFLSLTLKCAFAEGQWKGGLGGAMTGTSFHSLNVGARPGVPTSRLAPTATLGAWEKQSVYITLEFPFLHVPCTNQSWAVTVPSDHPPACRHLHLEPRLNQTLPCSVLQRHHPSRGAPEQEQPPQSGFPLPQAVPWSPQGDDAQRGAPERRPLTSMEPQTGALCAVPAASPSHAAPRLAGTAGPYTSE